MLSTLIPLVPLLALLPASSHASPLGSRAIPPIQAITTSQWNAFNQTVSGRLRQGVPFARSCFALTSPNMAGTLDAGTCATVQQNYKDEHAIADNFGAYENSNWATCQRTGETCLLDYNAPQNPLAYAPPRVCSQGSVSTYYVEVANEKDIQAIFTFAKQYKIPLAIKASGHDYKGRSSAPNSLGVWTHKITYISRNKKFVPAGCPASKTYDGVTFGAGNGFDTLYEFGEANNLTIVGGSAKTVVPSGGWIQGGGHSSVSNTLGLGVDRALQFKVVTPDGVFRTVSACQNTDLWFALRGGGGSTFGVILESTTTAAPRLTLQVAYVRFASIDTQSAAKFVALCVQNALKWDQEGWGGYIQPGALSNQASGLVLFNPKLTNAQAKDSMKPITDFAASLGQIPLNNEVTQEESFFQAYTKYLTPNEELVGLGVSIASRLLPKSVFALSQQSALVAAIVKGMNIVGENTLVGNGGVAQGLAYGGAPTQFLVTAPSNYKNYADSAVTPAWRDTVWHVLYAPTFNYNASPDTIAAAFSKANSAAQLLRDMTPNSGAYQNEASPFEPNHEQSFWGQANYDRLLKLKAKYDPNKLLACWQCIGWSKADITGNPRYSCYPNVAVN